jgi:hypothetical protein
MHAVSRFEFNLLRILQCVVGTTPVDHVRTPLIQPQPRPECLGRNAVELVKRSLATGIVMRMTRRGAWMNRRFLRRGKWVEGALWQRTSPSELGVSFSASSLELLMWLTAADGSSLAIPVWRPTPESPDRPFTLGDRLLQTSLINDWYGSEPFISNSLIALAMPDRFAAAGVRPVPDFDGWMTESPAVIIESLQSEWADWIERGTQRKASLLDPAKARSIGDCEDLVLGGFLAAAERHRRPDLCGFFLEAGNRLLTESSSARDWLGSVDVRPLRLSERQQVYSSGAALPRAICQFARWHRASRSVAFFDEGYAESQCLKSMWEQADGDRLERFARRMVDELALGALDWEGQSSSDIDRFDRSGMEGSP